MTSNGAPLTREEQAKREIGVTRITRAQKWVLNVSFLVLIFAVPVVQHVRELGLGQATTLGRAAAVPTNAVAAGRVAMPGGAATQPPRLRRLFRANSVLLHDIHAFEDTLVDDSLLTAALVPPVQEALTGALGGGNEKAYVGRHGWLFYRPDVDYVTAAGFLDPKRLTARAQSGTEWQPAPQPDPLIAVLQFRQQLAARGIALILVPTPAKPMIHPEMFSTGYAGVTTPVQNPSFGQFLHELHQPADFFARAERLLAPYRNVPDVKARRAWHWPIREAVDELVSGVPSTDEHRVPPVGSPPVGGEQPVHRLLAAGGSQPTGGTPAQYNPFLVFDPAPTLMAEKVRTGQPQYLKTDTHWRPEAVEGVVKALADFIRQHVDLPTQPAAGYTREARTVSNVGDIAVMMKLPPGQTLYPPQQVTIHQVVRGEAQWRPDPQADILLLGDSFTNIYSADAMGWGESAGLAEQLSFALQRPLDAIVRNDAGAYATREMLSAELARGHDRLAGKKVVIWQFAVRELTGGDWRVTTTPMRLGAPRPSALLALAPGERRLVAGTVRMATPAPRPGTVTYPDHVVYVHLTDLESLDGQPLNAGAALVATISMRNQVWTDAARYRPGQRVTLELRNYDDVDREQKVSTIKSSLPEDDLAFETPVWGQAPADAPAAAAAETHGDFGPREWAGVGAVFILVLLVVRFAEWREKRQPPEKLQEDTQTDTDAHGPTRTDAAVPAETK